MGKKLVRGSTWQPDDFYFGIPLALSTFSADLLLVLDQVRNANVSGTAGRETVGALLFGIAVFACYIWILTLHQDWERRCTGPDRRKQIIRLGILANAVGIGLFAGFVFLIKGVSL